MTTKVANRGDDTLESALTWDELGDVEHNDRVYADVKPVAEVLGRHSWLHVCQRIADRQGFYHWHLEFAPVFDAGGFSLQVGNPPWVRPDWDAAAALAEYDVRFALEGKMPVARASELRGQALTQPIAMREFVGLAGDQTAVRDSVSSTTMFPHLKGLRPDLYRCFMERTWEHQSATGITVLIHPETHLTDEKAGSLRAAAYRRLRRHWQFINELKLFEIHNLVTYGVHVYGTALGEPTFQMAASLYHPDTLERSLMHDGTGEEPGLKDPDGAWDLRPHRRRVLRVDPEMLGAWHSLIEDRATPQIETRTVYTVNAASAQALQKLSRHDRLGDLNFEYAMGWNEVDERRAGLFEIGWGKAGSWASAIMAGPHLYVGNPFYKSPNPQMSSNKDWSRVDLEALGASELPVTVYKPATSDRRYDRSFVHWGEGGEIPARACYRVMWRSMAATTGERTLMPALLPPGAVNLKQNLYSLGFSLASHDKLLLSAGMMSSLLADLLVRAVPKSSVPRSVVSRIPIVQGVGVEKIFLRVLRLNCLTDAYADLWSDTVPRIELEDEGTGVIE